MRSRRKNIALFASNAIKAAHILISTFIEDLNQPELPHALQASDGLCLPHLKLAFEAMRDIEASNTLLSIHREKLESLRGELDEFIRKNDYRFAEEGFGAEGDALAPRRWQSSRGRSQINYTIAVKLFSIDALWRSVRPTADVNRTGRPPIFQDRPHRDSDSPVA